jgi:hypothetical protein
MSNVRQTLYVKLYALKLLDNPICKFRVDHATAGALKEFMTKTHLKLRNPSAHRRVV